MEKVTSFLEDTKVSHKLIKGRQNVDVRKRHGSHSSDSGVTVYLYLNTLNLDYAAF